MWLISSINVSGDWYGHWVNISGGGRLLLKSPLMSLSESRRDQRAHGARRTGAQHTADVRPLRTGKTLVRDKAPCVWDSPIREKGTHAHALTHTDTDTDTHTHTVQLAHAHVCFNRKTLIDIQALQAQKALHSPIPTHTHGLTELWHHRAYIKWQIIPRRALFCTCTEKCPSILIWDAESRVCIQDKHSYFGICSTVYSFIKGTA